MEDATQVRAVPPDAPQSQSPAVAQCVAASPSPSLWTAEETARRAEILAKIAFSKTSTAVAKLNSTAAVKDVAPAASKLKRKRDDGVVPLKYLTLDDDEALLRAVALVKPGLLRLGWQRVADHITTEMTHRVSLKRCRQRYQFLMQMPSAHVTERFGVSSMLVKLVEDAQADFVARKEDPSAKLEPPEPRANASKAKKAVKGKTKDSKERHPAVVSKSSTEEARAMSTPPDEADNSEPTTTTIGEETSTQPPAASSIVEEPEGSSSHSSEVEPSPLEVVLTPGRVCLSCQQPESSLRDEIKELKTMFHDLVAKFTQSQVENTALKRDVQVLQGAVCGLSGVKHEVASLRSRLEERKRGVEWIKNPALIQTLQAEEFQKTALEYIARKSSEAAGVVEAGKRQLHEIIAIGRKQFEVQLRSQNQSLSRPLTEEIARIREAQEENSNTVRVFSEEFNRVRESQKVNSEMLKVFAEKMKHIQDGKESNSKALEGITENVWRIRESQATNSKAIEAFTEEVAGVRQELEKNHETIETFTEQITGVRRELEKNRETMKVFTREITAVRETQEENRGAIKAFTAEITGVRQEQEKNREANQEFAKAHSESEVATRQRQAIFYEMVEAERLAREKLERSIEKWKTRYESDQEAREESLLWFREEIHEQLQKLHSEAGREFTKVHENAAKQEDRVKLFEATYESRFHAYDDKFLLVARDQDEARRHSLDQYVQITIQLHDLRDTVDKERRDRSQDFRTLLQHVQRLVGSDLKGTLG